VCERDEGNKRVVLLFVLFVLLVLLLLPSLSSPTFARARSMAPAVVARTGAVRVWHCILALMVMVAVASLYFAAIGGYDVAPLHVPAVNVDVDVAIAAVDAPAVPVIFNDTWLVSYRKRHAELLATPAVPKRMFVYSCKRACGGLGDRMIGITNLLALSVLADRAVMLDQKDSDWVRDEPVVAGRLGLGA